MQPNHVLALRIVCAWVKAHSRTFAGTVDEVGAALAAVPKAEAALLVRARLEFHDEFVEPRGARALGAALVEAYRTARRRFPALLHAEMHIVPGGDAEDFDYDHLPSGSYDMYDLLYTLGGESDGVLGVLHLGLWTDFRDSDTRVVQSYEALTSMLRLPTGPKTVSMTVEHVLEDEDIHHVSHHALLEGWEVAPKDWSAAFNARKHRRLLARDKITATLLRNFLRTMHRAHEVFIQDDPAVLGPALSAAFDLKRGPKATYDSRRRGWLVEHRARH